MHLLLYNRDPHLMKYYLEWMDAWAKHAMADVYGKPPGFLPAQVTFKTGEPGGYTKNWWGAGAHDFNSLWYRTRLHGMLVVAYVLTGDEKYITPLREMMRFLSTYARPAVPEGEPLPPDRLPQPYTFPEGWRDGTAGTRYARDVGWGHPGNWYYYVTGDTQFDAKFSKLFNDTIERGPFPRIDKGIVERGYRRAKSFRDGYFDKVVPKLKYGGSTANYAAAWAEQRHARGKRASLLQAFLHGVGCFIKMYVIRAGFLDGRQGLLLSLLSAHSTYVKYADLWVRNQKQN